jgi:lysophosphatidic acid phosphatase type 6
MMMSVALLVLLLLGAHADAPDYGALLREVRFKGIKHYCGVAPGVRYRQTATPPASGKGAAGALAHVVMVMRHGDRSSWGWYADPAAVPRGRLSCWPGDNATWSCEDATHNEFVGDSLSHRVAAPWLYRRVYVRDRNVQAGTCAQGVLTNRGIRQQISNGHVVRVNYVDGNVAPVLPAAWVNATRNTFYLRTTNVPRTIQSGDAMFWGIYGNVTAPSSTAAIPVIDLHTMDETMDNMTPNPGVCPGIVAASARATSSPAFLAFQKNYLDPLVAEVATAIGYPNLTSTQMEALLDCARAHLCHGKPLHPGLTTSLLERMAAAVTFSYEYLFTFPTPTQAARLTIGTLFADIVEEIETGATVGRRFSLFSGHDTTVLPMLMALNVTNALWPPYAATLFFEVSHQSSQPSAVSVKYLDQLLPVPGCAAATVCTWSEFRAFVKTLQPSASDCAA